MPSRGTAVLGEDDFFERDGGRVRSAVLGCLVLHKLSLPLLLTTWNTGR